MGAYCLSWAFAAASFAAFKLLPSNDTLRWEILAGGLFATACLQAMTLFMGKKASPESEATAATFE